MEAIGQLTGGIAHDFNNILTVITGTIGILGEAVENSPDLAEIAQLITDAAARGAALTQHLLAFARKQPLQPIDVDVNRLMPKAIELLRPTIGGHQYRIRAGRRGLGSPGRSEPAHDGRAQSRP
jgi:signal transduction histidine kinase